MAYLRPDLLLYVGEVEGMTSGQVVTALETVGLPVRVATCLREARAAVRFLPVRLVVIGLDGELDVWQLLRFGPQIGRDVPVVCASGRVVRSRVLAALRRGARTVLVSPFTADEVRSKLEPVLAGDEPAEEEEEEAEEQGAAIG